MFGNLFSLKISLSLFFSQNLHMNIRKKFDFQQAMSIKSGAKTKNLRVAAWKVGQTWQRNNCSRAKKYNKNIETLHAKQFFPFYLTQASKIYVATSHSVVRLETIEISDERTAFIWIFAQAVDWCIKDCDKERLQTTAFINVWKILPGYTGDWLDVKTASTCTTELWDALKSFILDSLKIKVAPHPIIVSLDTLKRWRWDWNLSLYADVTSCFLRWLGTVLGQAKCANFCREYFLIHNREN